MERNEIIRTLSGFMDMNKDRYEIIRIGVFGSAARDSMNEQSDIDVVVESLANWICSTLSASNRIWRRSCTGLCIL